MENYLAAFEYGNHDMSGGVNKAWVSSSLKVSAREQVDFVRKMLLGELPVSSHAAAMTRAITFKEELPQGWKLHGKTGLGSFKNEDGKTIKVRWFTGWIEKEHTFYPFSYNFRAEEIDVTQAVPRVKVLLVESNVMTEE